MQDSSITPENVHFHCRCCLMKFADSNSINTNDMPRPIFQLYRYCTGFRMWQKGLYPEGLCLQCYEQLKSFELFEKKCKKSSCILDELLNGQKISKQASTASLQTTNDEIITKTSKNCHLAENEHSTPIVENTDNTKNNCSIENFDVKPEVENENESTNKQNIDSDLENSLALPEFDDAEIKSESSFAEQCEEEFICHENPKQQNNFELPCKCCSEVFTTKEELKQHVNKTHEDKLSENLKKARKTGGNRSADREQELQSTELDSLDTDIAEPSSTAFENVVVIPQPESPMLEIKQNSDSDFEDSLALAELRKSGLRSKAKKSASARKQQRKRSSSRLNSENESFGPVKIEKPKVVCDKCPRKFKWPFELRRHIKEMHGDKPLELPCKYDCGKIFNSQNTLKSHYRIKHQLKKQIYRENAYICEQCGKGFKRLPLLERHRFHHLPPEARPYKCEQCGKTFVMERIYKEHLLRHSGNKKYECSYCGIKKATLGEYREHINIHTKEKEYACELCPKIFYRSKNLVQHVSAVHQGIKKHFCRYCQHSFANHINLVHHERIHTGEKPYSCEICQRSFIQPSALKTHMKTHDETRIKAKVGRKPKNSKAKVDFGFENVIDNNLQQPINNYNE